MAEQKARIKKTERHSQSDIEKGRARYRAAKRRKASLETERYHERQGAQKMRKKLRERIAARE